MFLSASQLAPVRSCHRIGASVFRLKAPIDMTILSLLEVQREVKMLQATQDPEEQHSLFFGVVRSIFLDALPDELPVDDCLPAIV